MVKSTSISGAETDVFANNRSTKLLDGMYKETQHNSLFFHELLADSESKILQLK